MPAIAPPRLALIDSLYALGFEPDDQRWWWWARTSDDRLLGLVVRCEPNGEVVIVAATGRVSADGLPIDAETVSWSAAYCADTPDAFLEAAIQEAQVWLKGHRW
jgi:hypothetical protein